MNYKQLRLVISGAMFSVLFGLSMLASADDIVGLITKSDAMPMQVKMTEAAKTKAAELGWNLQVFAGKYNGDYESQIAAIEDPQKRKAYFDEMVARMYEHGKAVNIASAFEIDDVIDPMESRRWIIAALDSSSPPAPREGKKRAWVDTW